jgi:hypothetical protein
MNNKNADHTLIPSDVPANGGGGGLQAPTPSLTPVAGWSGVNTVKPSDNYSLCTTCFSSQQIFICICSFLDDRAIEVPSPTEARDFSSNLCVQTGSGAHPTSCLMGTGGPFQGGKARPGRDADHSPLPSSAEVINE